MFPKARFRSDRFTSDLTHTLASHGLWRGHHAVGCPCLLNSSLCLFAVVSSDKCASRHVVANCSILDGSLHPLTASCVRIRSCLYSMRLSSIHYPKLPLSNHNHAPSTAPTAPTILSPIRRTQTPYIRGSVRVVTITGSLCGPTAQGVKDILSQGTRRSVTELITSALRHASR
jgi:hypothetical protein